MSRAPGSLYRALNGVANALAQGARHSSGTQLHTSVQLLPPLISSCNASQPHSVLSTRAATSQSLVHLKQQHQQSSSSSSSSTSWPKLAAAGAAAAGAAAAGWAVWSDTAAVKRAQALAEQSNTAGESRVSPQTQAALVSCYAGPLVSLLQGSSPAQPQLQALAAAVSAEAALLNPWELVNALWGLAMFGVQLNPGQLQKLTNVLENTMSHMTVYQAAIAAWAVTMLSGSSSSSSSVWQQLLLRLKAAAVQEYDDAAVLYLLHAAMQQAAAAAAAAGKGNLGPSPCATEQEVLQQLDGLPKAAKAKVAAAYKEYCPFQQYIEGPYLVILHVARVLPSMINAGAASAAVNTASSSSGSTGSGSSSSAVLPYQAVFGGFSGADAAGAVTVMSNSSVLKKLRRNLYFGWRSEQLLDRPQASSNEVYYVLSRRLNIREVQQPPDIDILLPTLKTGVFLEDDVSQPNTPNTSSSSSNSTTAPTSHRAQQQQQQQQQMSDAQYLQQCQAALATLVRNRYAAPPGGFHAKSTAGITAAKFRCLVQRGWRVVVLKVSEVEACLQGAGAVVGGRNKARDLAAGHAALEALLRERLRI